MEKLVLQMFISGTGEYLDNLLAKGLGGVIFFTKDIQDSTQFKSLIKSIKNKSLVTPFLSIDQEGGRVERTENIHQRFLSPRFAWQRGAEFLQKQTHAIGEELYSYGINLNFAPCIDVNTNPDNPIIGERAFADNPNDVIKAMNIVIEEYRKTKIIPCVKHYPGHGDADKDSHLTLPNIDLAIDKMEKIHILPFKKAIEKDIEMIMAAHLHCACFDNEIIPSSLSKNAIGYLRNRLNYNGVIISDDMMMKGVSQYGLTQAFVKGIKAGLDMFIYREADINIKQALQELILLSEQDIELKSRIIESNTRISHLKNKIK